MVILSPILAKFRACGALKWLNYTAAGSLSPRPILDAHPRRRYSLVPTPRKLRLPFVFTSFSSRGIVVVRWQRHHCSLVIPFVRGDLWSLKSPAKSLSGPSSVCFSLSVFYLQSTLHRAGWEPTGWHGSGLTGMG